MDQGDGLKFTARVRVRITMHIMVVGCATAGACGEWDSNYCVKWSLF